MDRQPAGFQGGFGPGSGGVSGALAPVGRTVHPPVSPNGHRVRGVGLRGAAHDELHRGPESARYSGGPALYFAKRSRIAQVIALNVVSFGWHFVLVYLQVRTWPDFQMVQMFTTYYEWMGGLLATPLLLCYNGQRGAGYRRFFYAFYPAHIYILYALSWAPSPGHGLKKGGSIMAHILVVDDDADLRQLLLTALGRTGTRSLPLDRAAPSPRPIAAGPTVFCWT